MIKPKMKCFRYKNYAHIFVSRVILSFDQLLSILDIFQSQKIIAIIESGENFQTTFLSSVGMQTNIKIHRSSPNRLIIISKKDDLSFALRHTNTSDLEELFIAGINEEKITDELVQSLELIAASMVKNRISDMSFSINFAENEMILSLDKTRYSVLATRNYVKHILLT